MDAAQFDGSGGVLDVLDEGAELVDLGLEPLGLAVGEEVLLELPEPGEHRLGGARRISRGSSGSARSGCACPTSRCP